LFFLPSFRKPSGFFHRDLIFTCIKNCLIRKNRQGIWAEFYEKLRSNSDSGTWMFFRGNTFAQEKACPDGKQP
jgi:hypothetical protein